MSLSLVPKTILGLIEPAVVAVAGRLFVLTTGRTGSKNFQPTVMSFYETGLVTSLYEQLLMSPALRNYEIRHEMPYRTPGVVGTSKRVDIWLRPVIWRMNSVFYGGMDRTRNRVIENMEVTCV